jgi:hypothetical protein
MMNYLLDYINVKNEILWTLPSSVSRAVFVYPVVLTFTGVQEPNEKTRSPLIVVRQRSRDT